jgi:hypothetical protein
MVPFSQPPKPAPRHGLLVVVVGPRSLKNKGAVLATLEKAHRHKPFRAIVHGGTPGPELIAAEWALAQGLQAICCAADWVTHQELGAIERNRRMIRDYRPDGVIIYPGTLFGDDLEAFAGASKVPVWKPWVPWK